MSRLGRFRSLRICLFSHQTLSPRVAVEQDLGPVSPVRFPDFQVASPHPHAAGQRSSVRFGRFGPATRCARSTFQGGTTPDVGMAFGISSAESAGREGHRKDVQNSSTYLADFNEMRVLIISWSQVRVLAGPPSPIEFTNLCRRERGIGVPWCNPLAG
jgi:hypothetical protein